MGELRHRGKDSSSTNPDKITSGIEAEDRVRFSVLDVLRVLGGIFLLSSALSWFITNDSIFWGYRPVWTRPAVGIPANGTPITQKGSIHLTDAELTRYNGTDSSLPIYLAINGTIFDVSASPTFYGPGGSYHFFAGRDATRAYVTGCFAEDITPDTRGVEEMFIPVDETGDEAGLSKGELKKRKEQDRRIARKQLRESVGHWERFFGDSSKYHRVGRVRREEGWLEKIPRRELCEAARKARPKRKKG
ncbi:MAG: hypothetical protein M1812_002139 [Candelaria pacifica]|nr:MAG: hypothetical protein M1812_002139 [Candelaria pacifica]